MVPGANLVSLSLTLIRLCWIYTGVTQNGIWPFWFSLVIGHGIHPYLLSDSGDVPKVRLVPQMLGK